MDILFVRHGESEGNAHGRLQGRLDSPLSPLGSEQALRLGNWLASIGFRWDVAYASPLLRAWETAQIACRAAGGSAPESDPKLCEIGAGRIEGLTRDEIIERHPSYIERRVTDLGDFSDFGGESYDDVQLRARDVRTRLEALHRAAGARVLLVGHGGFNFQLVKYLLCEPVPRVCILKMGNCTASLVRMRERRGSYMGELLWHVPVELMGGSSQDAGGALFR
ncbi:MAG: histidine phosphatase family protein [Polyangiaceae bacterium]